jgi:amidase
MSFADYTKYDGLGLAELVACKEVQPSELVEAAIDRIEAVNPGLNAVIQKLYDQGRAAAAGPLPDGPFTGVPYLLKDMVVHQGTPLTLGSNFLRKAGYIPTESHPVVARTEQAGVIILGKTNACEFGLLPTTEPEAYGATANPWALAHSPGGSSGGSGAAVAAGMVPLAHGNDGGGSVRIPASCCGVFGLKPSRGRNPGTAEGNADGVVVEHCLTRSVRDSAAMLDVTQGPLPGDRWWAPPPARPYLDEVAEDPKPLRIAFTTADLVGRPAHPDCVAAVEDAARLCEELGHRVEQAGPAVDGERFNKAFAVTWSSMATSMFFYILQEAKAQERVVALAARALGDRVTLAAATRLLARSLRSPFERRTQAFATIGDRITHAQAIVAGADLQQASYQMAHFFGQYDCLLTPVLGEPPLVTGALDSVPDDQLEERLFTYGGYTPICNSAGLPAMSVPLHWNPAGLPIGVQFMGPFDSEAMLFGLAGQLERARPWLPRLLAHPCS